MAGIYIAAMSASRGNVLVSLITTTYVIVKHIENMNNVFVSDSLVQLQFNCEILRSALTSYSNRETLLYGYGTVLCCVHSFVKYQKAHTAKKYFSHSPVPPALGFCTLLRVVEETTHHTHTHTGGVGNIKQQTNTCCDGGWKQVCGIKIGTAFCMYF